MLLDEYERWTGDTRLVRELEFEARAALRWIDQYADLQGNGYIAYQRRNQETGLEPVLEGLLGLHLLPRRHASSFPGPPASSRVRLRRQTARRPPGPPDLA